MNKKLPLVLENKFIVLKTQSASPYRPIHEHLQVEQPVYSMFKKNF